MGKRRRLRESAPMWAERDWYSIRAEDTGRTAEVLIYDRIGEGFFTEGVTAKGLAKELAALDVDRLDVRINSPGGSVFDGLAIYNAIKAHPAEVTTHIDGLAASIASVIAMAGDEVRMAGNALLMIHSPWSAMVGTAQDLRKEADLLDKVQDSMIAIYAEASGQDHDDIRAALAAETWYTAEEADQAGYIDAVAEESPAAAAHYNDLSLFAMTAPPRPAAQPEKEATVAAQKTEAAPAPDPALTERIDQLEARLAEAARPDPAPPPVSVPRVFAQLVTEYGQDRSQIARNAADMVSSGNTGLTDTARTSKEIIDYFDATRYFTSRVEAIPFPESGIVHTLPKKTQRSQVGQANEKAAAPSRAITTDTVQFTGVWYKGYLDISYELIRTSSPGAVAVAVDDMLDEAALESELEFVAAVEAASTLSAGLALDFTSVATLGADVRAVVRELRAAAGRGLPKFALTPASFDSLVTMVDGDGRRVFATNGPSNADGATDLVSDSVSAFGCLFFDSPNSTVDIAFNDNALKRSELAPMQLSADNVPNIGRDVGILGNIMAVPRISEGVLRLAAV